VEYKALPWLALRAGYAFENEIVPDKYVDYLVPAVGYRHNFSLGTGFGWQDMTLDLAYTMVLIPNPKANNSSQAAGVLPSDFQGRLSHVVVMSLGYKF
jgi:long-subunit fatty acid transport protein